jgi:L-fucose isomerase-like protein
MKPDDAPSAAGPPEPPEPPEPSRPSPAAGTPLRPTLGVLLVTSGWFREVGLQDAGSDTTAAVERTAGVLLERLRAFADPVCHGVLVSPGQAARSAREIRQAGVDGLLLAPLMWCEDAIPRAALGELAGLPLILWTFSPAPALPDPLPFQAMLQGSGPVGALQLSGMLKREGRPFHPVAGHLEDGEVYREIESLARAMAAARRLRGARVGVLPFRCDQMSATYVDEFALRARYGAELRYLELERVRRAARDARPEELAALRARIEGAGVRVEVDERNLTEGLKYALAMERIAREEGLAVLAMNDVIPEMHASFGLRPCLTHPDLAAGTVVAMEADIAAGLAMHVLRLFTGRSPFYTETFGADYRENALLLGHAGYHDSANADPDWPVRIIPDVEYRNSDPFTGAVTFFKYRPGPVTVVNSVWDGEGLQWTGLEGISRAGPPRLEGNAHLVLDAEVPLARFFRQAAQSGVSQHWIVVPGRRLEELGRLCGILGVRFQAVEPA